MKTTARHQYGSSNECCQLCGGVNKKEQNCVITELSNVCIFGPKFKSLNRFSIFKAEKCAVWRRCEKYQSLFLLHSQQTKTFALHVYTQYSNISLFVPKIETPTTPKNERTVKSLQHSIFTPTGNLFSRLSYQEAAQNSYRFTTLLRRWFHWNRRFA